MLAVHLAQVSYEESILVADLAVFGIDAIDTLLKSLPNQLLSAWLFDDAMIVVGESWCKMLDRIIGQEIVVCLSFVGSDCRRCHSTPKQLSRGGRSD